MLPLLKKFKLNSSVLSIGASGEGARNCVLMLDSAYHLYALRGDKFIFSKKILDFVPQHAFSKACAVSMQGYIAIGVPKSNVCEILRFQDSTLSRIKSLSWHRADIYNIRFSRDGKYLVTGGEDGKVFVFGLPNFHCVSILPPRPDYISNIHFGRIAKLLVYSSYDLQNCVFDMVQNKIVGIFETNAVVEDIVFFDGDRKIFCVCANGECGIYDVRKKSLDLRKNYDFWLTRTGLTKDDNYAYIGARESKLSYLNLSTNTSAFSVNLSCEEGIASMRIIDANLHIGYANGIVEIFNLASGEDKLQAAIKRGNFRKAREISDKNISLKTHKIYIDFMEKSFEAEFQKAKDSLQNNATQENLTKILQDLDVFFEDTNKREKFSQYLANIGIFKDFNDAFLRKDYALAYKIADENTLLKQTLEFERLEGIFNDTFESAKTLLLKDTFDSKNAANALLKPFLNIPSKKEVISKLLRNTDKFAQADTLLKGKKFVEYFKLAESFKEIQSTANYKKALAFGEQLLATINGFSAKREYEKALELNEILLKCAPFAKIAAENKQNIGLEREFLALFSQKDFKKIYANIDKYELLKALPEYVEMGRGFDRIFDNALEMALNGRGEAVCEMLKEYMNIEFWREKITNIFNLSYLHEINTALESADSSVHWRLSLESYVNMFGKNDEIMKICDKTDKMRDTLKAIEPTPQEVKYLPSILVRI